MKRILFSILLAALLSACSDKVVYLDADASVEARVEDLISRMTVNEKVGQLLCPLGWPMYTKADDGTVEPSELFQKRMQEMPLGGCWAVLRADPWTQKTLETGLNPRLAAETLNKLQKYAVENTRLGIPMLFAEEAVHGHMAIGTTVFPTGLGMASTFDEALVKQVGEAVALEVRSQGGNVGYGPVLDIARDPRWGRIEETMGEDPVLVGILGTAMVRGMQGENIADGAHVFSTLKHFAAYGVPEGGHNGEQTNVGMRALFNEYIPQFKRAIKAGAATVMTSYNAIDGVPCTCNKHLLTDVLRHEWGFEGAVYSDLVSIEGIANNHNVAADYSEAGTLALKAGVSIDLQGDVFGPYIEENLKAGKVEMEDLDRAVADVLRLKFRMGLFENPYVDPDKAAQVVRSAEHKALARKVAQESTVLLKNNGILPLSKELKNVAVIGPNADMIYNQLGDYTAPQDRSQLTTVLDGVKNTLPDANVRYVKGCAIRDVSATDIPSAVAAAKASEVTILVVGGSSARDFKTSYIETGAAVATDNMVSDMETGEGMDRASLSLMGDQEKLMRALLDAGVKLVVVYIEGRPLDMNLAAERADALLTAWYPGEQGGQAIADILFGDVNPAGRLPISVPRNVGQIPVYYSRRVSHDYADLSQTPLYAFGYGLSYSTFEYSDLEIIENPSPEVYATVKAKITNTSQRDGDEVVQLYINDVKTSVEISHKLLKVFKRVPVKAGETVEVSFDLGFDELSLYNINMKQVVESGVFKVMIGASSDDLRLEGDLVI